MSIARPTAAVVLFALSVALLMLVVLDLRDNDGAAVMIALFGIPMIAAAIVVQFYLSAAAGIRAERPMQALEEMQDAQRVSRSFLWWILLVLPVGVLAGAVFAILREPDYFLGDGPWMLIWLPIFVAVALLLGGVVWFFFVFPVALLVKAVRASLRGEGAPAMYVWPIVLLLIGALCIVGGLSTDFATVGKAATIPVILSILGIPGPYQVLWEPGLWIVRGIIAVLMVLFVATWLKDRPARRAEKR
ncbi:hypothetical protein DY023_16415 [Microbacterium bovistercoris]|uniref:Uncharacterized protein n=1 Tax=Microbacterium bovistercoris TaxID=2293570 RepID=A0A371NQJ4_9MICO|nr:hypothetical protein [Microbacterium bovistercoris]REJ03905.1 hypothetical protein DY023_16415 [Microbacterium bovistercoris]